MSHKQPKERKIQDFSMSHWAMIIGLAIYFIFFPYNQGLFNSFTYSFEPAIYEAMLYIFALFMLMVLLLVKSWKINYAPALYTVGALMLPIIYWLSSFQAVAYHNAELMTMISFALSIFFIFGLYLGTSQDSTNAFQVIVLLSGHAIVIYGVANMLGLVYANGAIWFTSNTYRITSVFQYSNTYAGFLLAMLMATLFVSINAKRTFVSLINAFMLVPIWISLMLTYSRGALVFIPLLVIGILLFLRLDRQIAFIASFVISAIVSFAILSTVTENYIRIAQAVLPSAPNQSPNLLSFFEPEVWHTALLILAASIFSAIFTWGLKTRFTWLDRKLSKWSNAKLSPFVLPASLTIFGTLGVIIILGTGIAAALFPDSIASRLENINFQQHSVLERMTFYRDAMKAVADYPLLGAGGGGWTALYEQYQNNPYISRQAHSYFVQTLVEVGWIGFIVLLLLLVSIFYLYLKNYWKERSEQPGHFLFFILAFTILAHSMIDFDMSYVYIGSLVFLSLGILISVYKDKLIIPKLTPYAHSKWRYMAPGMLGLMAVILLVQVYQEYAGSSHFQRSLDMAAIEKRPLPELLVPLNRAIAYSPNHPSYTITKVDWLSQAFRQTGIREYALDAQAYLQSIKRSEPYDRTIILAEYRNHKDLGEYNESMESIEEGISKFQWDINFYEAAIMEYAVNGQRVKPSDPAAANAYWERGLELYTEVLRRMELLKNLPEEQLQGRDFGVTPFIRQAVGQILFEQRQYEEAIDMLQPLVGSDLNETYNRTGIRYYLAALHALGQNNENLTQLLIEADPDERMYLDSLYQSIS